MELHQPRATHAAPGDGESRLDRACSPRFGLALVSMRVKAQTIESPAELMANPAVASTHCLHASPIARQALHRKRSAQPQTRSAARAPAMRGSYCAFHTEDGTKWRWRKPLPTPR